MVLPPAPPRPSACAPSPGTPPGALQSGPEALSEFWPNQVFGWGLEGRAILPLSFLGSCKHLAARARPL